MTPILFHRAPEFSAPLQLRWLANSAAYLAKARVKTSFYHRARLTAFA
jgi:hypothetical protein